MTFLKLPADLPLTFGDLIALSVVSVPCNPRALAEAAVASVAKVDAGKDGISYLMALIEAGVETALTARYREEVLALTGASTLAEARDAVRRRH